MARPSKQVKAAFADVAVEYSADLDGHWVTLKPGFEYQGGRIVHEWTVPNMLRARRELEVCQ